MECSGSTFVESCDEPIEIKNVLHVPGLAANLLSVSKIVENGNIVSFDKNGCTIKNSDEKVLLKCKSTCGVYKVEPRNLCMLTKVADSAMDWHRRLGHTNYQTLIKMKKDPSYGINFNDDDKQIKNCEICARGKQTRNSFATSDTKTDRALQLIHYDLAGPMENISYGMTRYCIRF